MVHHGSDRIKQSAEFKQASRKHDVVITSFTLARKDENSWASNGSEWYWMKNIKIPKRLKPAILKLPAKHRLNRKPVENLLDLWSIFNFLNPGYLGKEAQFRKFFEIPIQKTMTE